MAGTVDLLQRGYTGIVTRGDVLWLNPCLPDELSLLDMTVRYRGHTLDLRVTRDLLEVHSRASNASPIHCRVVNETRTLQAGETHGFPIDAGTRGRRDPTADA
jgi:trehalose/maltose hydrolase-like predicted phosphorylase